MSVWRKLQLAWKYRRPLWKYRKLIRHRKQIAVGALCAGVLITAAVVQRRGAAAN